MPIYEYLCAECAHTLDALQKLSDEQLVYCPQCGAPALKRQMSAPSFRLKGGGWYETDFKQDKRRNIAETDSKTTDKGDGKGEGKAEGEGKGKAEGKGEKAGKPDKADKPTPAAEAKKSESGTVAAKKPDAGKAGGVA